MKKWIFALTILSIIGCTDKLDFDQADNLEITPVYEGDILYLDLNKNNLVDSQGNFRAIVQDTISFGIFEDGKIRDGFEKAEIYVKYNNSFQRSFSIEYYFIDANKQAVEQNSFTISAATTGQNVTGEEIFIFDKTINPDFINFRKIVVKVSVTPTTLPVEDEQLHIQTKGTFYTKIVIN